MGSIINTCLILPCQIRNSRLDSVDTTDSSVTEIDSRNPQEDSEVTTSVIVHNTSHQETAL